MEGRSEVLFSFICPCNDRAVFDECTGASLAAQSDRDFELILVDTCAQRYSSAAAALNAGAARAKGDYFVFLHQDICFFEADFVQKLRGWVERCDFAVAGVAGANRGKSKFRSLTSTNIVHGAKKRHPGKYLPEDEAAPCQTLDECLFIIPAPLFRERGFREYVPTWHAHAVEYSLWARRANAGPILVFPLKLWHRSAAASYNMNYFDAIDAVRREYRDLTDVIYTTMGAWPTGALLFHLKRMYRVAKFRRRRRR